MIKTHDSRAGRFSGIEEEYQNIKSDFNKSNLSFSPFSLVKPVFLLSGPWPSALRLRLRLLSALCAASKNAPAAAPCSGFNKHPCHRKNGGELSHASFAGNSPRNFFQEVGRLNFWSFTKLRPGPTEAETLHFYDKARRFME